MMSSRRIMVISMIFEFVLAVLFSIACAIAVDEIHERSRKKKDKKRREERMTEVEDEETW